MARLLRSQQYVKPKLTVSCREAALRDMDQHDIALEILKAVNAYDKLDRVFPLDRPTLLALASVNRFWYSLAVPELYSIVCISTQ